jgi:3D (Asp-Asp-Asp) domain-containing protein
VGFDRSATLAAESAPSAEIPESQPESETAPEPVEVLAVEPVTESDPEWDLSTRWFDGRPVRPSKVVLMRVTGYSPDSRSCGEFADGQTATLHSVWTNAMRLVAADPKVLPYGTMLTVPGYADGEIVPVLDCGGAIKGARLDLLFPTHEVALNWGVQDLRVVVWEYADGQPAPNPRRVR